MDWTPLGWALDAARSVLALPQNLLAECLALALLYLAVIALGIAWLRSPEAPSLDDEEPRRPTKP